MFLDAGSVLEESGWRGFAMPVVLRRQRPLGGSAVLAALTLKLLVISVVMTFFWARAGQASILAIAMHGLSNDVARVGGLTDPLTWQIEVITELNLAAPSLVAAVVVFCIAQRRGWADLRGIPADGF